jgi:hypothetical protein
MTKGEELFSEIAKAIPGIKEGKMFSALCMKTPNGKSAAMFWKENIVVKLEEDDMIAALALDGSEIFEPMEGRQMTGWIQIPYKYKDEWKKLSDFQKKKLKEELKVHQ